MRKKIGAILLTLPLCAASMLACFTPRLTAHADRQSFYAEGATASGALLTQVSPVVVVKEKLDVVVRALPVSEWWSVTLDEQLSHVTTTYTLYNPAGDTHAVHFFYPIAARPSSYATPAKDLKYALSVGEEVLEPTVRHSYVGNYTREFDVDRSLAQMTPGVLVDSFYSDNLPVREYMFSINIDYSAFAGVDRNYLSFGLTFDCNPATTRIMSASRMFTEIANGRVMASFDVTEGKNELSLAVAGEDVRNLSYGIYTDRFRENRVDLGELPYEETETTFREYAREFYPKKTEISEDDWFNGFVEMLSTNTRHGCLVRVQSDSIREEAFMEWYEYFVEVPANTSVEHKIVAPLWPQVDGLRYDFSYLLSPQQRWASASDVEINIETPYYLAYSSLVFEQEGRTYTFQRNCMPLGELSFTLMHSEEEFLKATTSDNVAYDSTSPTLRLAYTLLWILGGVALLAAAVAVFVFGYRKNKK